MIDLIRNTRRALVIGIGGGGDVVGALATARLCESLGTEFELGGVAERFDIDPHPGPRRIDEIRGGRDRRLRALLADESTTTPDGTRFAEAGLRLTSGA